MIYNDYATFNPYIIACGRMSIKDCPPTGTVFEERIVRWYELELMSESEEGYVITEGAKIPVAKGDIFIRKPGMIVRGVSAYGCYSIIFDNIYDPSLKKEYSEPRYDNATTGFLYHMKMRNFTHQILDDLPFKIKSADYHYLKELFEMCFEHYIRQENDYLFHAKTILFNILSIINSENKKQQITLKPSNLENSYNAVLKSKQFINSNFKSNINLKQLAQKVGYNPEYFCRVFKKTLAKILLTIS